MTVTDLDFKVADLSLAAFGRKGFAAVTTRQIADAADTNLPGLTYYFGNKEGLYLACAHDIVASFRQGVGSVAAVAVVSARYSIRLRSIARSSAVARAPAATT